MDHSFAFMADGTRPTTKDANITRATLNNGLCVVIARGALAPDGDHEMNFLFGKSEGGCMANSKRTSSGCHIVARSYVIRKDKHRNRCSRNSIVLLQLFLGHKRGHQLHLLVLYWFYGLLAPSYRIGTA